MLLSVANAKLHLSITLFLNNFGKKIKTSKFKRGLSGRGLVHTYLCVLLKLLEHSPWARPSIRYDISITESHNELKLCTCYVLVKVDVQWLLTKKLVIKVTFSGPGPYTAFYDMGSNSTIAC